MTANSSSTKKNENKHEKWNEWKWNGSKRSKRVVHSHVFMFHQPHIVTTCEFWTHSGIVFHYGICVCVCVAFCTFASGGGRLSGDGTNGTNRFAHNIHERALTRAHTHNNNKYEKWDNCVSNILQTMYFDCDAFAPESMIWQEWTANQRSNKNNNTSHGSSVVFKFYSHATHRRNHHPLPTTNNNNVTTATKTLFKRAKRFLLSNKWTCEFHSGVSFFRENPMKKTNNNKNRFRNVDTFDKLFGIVIQCDAVRFAAAVRIENDSAKKPSKCASLQSY